MAGGIGFAANQARLAVVEGASKFYDSRLEILCARWGVEAEPFRERLRAGHSLAFCRDECGLQVPVHTIRPEQI